MEKFGNNIFLPRHLVLLGLLMSLGKYADANGILGGYAFIKNSLKERNRQVIDEKKENYDMNKEIIMIWNKKI